METYIFEGKKLKVTKKVFNNTLITYYRYQNLAVRTNKHRLLDYYPNFSSIPRLDINDTNLDGIFLGYLLDENLNIRNTYYTNIPDLRILWVSFDDPEKYAYLRANKTLKFDKDYLQRHGTKLTRSKLIDKYKLAYVDDYFLPEIGEKKFEFIPAEEAYTSNGPSSCMTDRPELIDFYALHNAKALVYKLKDRIRARCIAWKIDGKIVCDRIYGFNDSDKYILQNFIDGQGYDRREDFSAYFGEFKSKNKYKIKCKTFCAVPWLDTFKGLKLINDEWFLVNEDSSLNYVYNIQNSSGTYLDHLCNYCHGECRKDNGGTVCVDCGERVHEDDVYYAPGGETYCDACFCENYFHCIRCGEVEHNDDRHIYNDNDYCSHCFDQVAAYCDDCGEATALEELNNGYCESCYTEHYFYCDDCGEDHEMSECNATDDGNYCDDCYAKIKEHEEV